MNAPSEDIKDMLEAVSSLGLTFGTDLFIAFEPDNPDECVTLFDTTGRQPALSMDGSTYERPSLQVRVRSNSYENGWDLIENIKNSLHGRAQESWNGTLYSIIYTASGPAMLDYDEQSRVRFIVNFDMQRR